MSTTSCLINSWLRRSRNSARRGIDQAQFALGGTEQPDSDFTVHASIFTVAIHNASAKEGKFDLAGLNFFGTVCVSRAVLLLANNNVPNGPAAYFSIKFTD